jgi:copper chaperone CopZ
MNLLKFIILFGVLLSAQFALAQGTPPVVKKLKIHVEGKCAMCTDRIQTFAILTTGVMEAEYDLPRQILSIKYNKNTFDQNQLHQNIANAGHSTNKVKADEEAYSDLPGCCQYDGVPETANNSMVNGNIIEFSDVATPQQSEFTPNITGMIYEKDPVGNKQPLIGATVRWLNQNDGTVTDLEGYFYLDRVDSETDIEVSYVGYQSDTISMQNESMVSIVLTDAMTLNTVEVVHRKKTTEISFLNPIKVQNIDEKEFMKAACCNIAESFETNPSVDISFTDAVTGTKKIQLLGLEGPNIQVMRENMPYIRGLAAIYGFEFTPATWLEGMQLNMGTGSVANGFEGLAGQINIELKKPCSNMEKLYLNLYANEGGRTEFNANIRHDINDKWHAATLLHTKKNFIENDRNDDGFLDNPLAEHVIALHRWKFIGDDGFRWQAGIKGTLFDNTSGQVGFDKDVAPETSDTWGASTNINRIEGWMKFGKVFLDNPLASMGLQLSGSHHDQKAIFGTRVYNAKQSSFYGNFIYQNIITSTKHKYRVGYSFQYDKFDELVLLTPFNREEISTGIFGEYSFKPSEKFTAVIGLRQDHHNSYGVFFTPRTNLRFAPNDDTVFRLAAGRSLRTANVFAENIGLFASNRRILFTPGAPANFPNGLQPEIGWNFGANVSKAIRIGAREFVFGADYYYTFFESQVVVDYDHNPQQVSIYNLDGPSYSHSIQAQVDVEILPMLDVRLAYRFNDVRTRYIDGILRKPLISAHRAFVNVAYEIENKWAFDATFNLQGARRIPSTASNPEEFRLEDNSPNFVTLNGQITRKWKGFDWYVGVENALNYRQENPIISAENPNSEFFDSALVWGPIFGRMVYTGFRYKI